MKMFIKLWRDEGGATAVEYSVLLALSGAVVIGAYGLLGTNIAAIFTALKTALQAL